MVYTTHALRRKTQPIKLSHLKNHRQNITWRVSVSCDATHQLNTKWLAPSEESSLYLKEATKNELIVNNEICRHAQTWKHLTRIGLQIKVVNSKVTVIIFSLSIQRIMYHDPKFFPFFLPVRLDAQGSNH